MILNLEFSLPPEVMEYVIAPPCASVADKEPTVSPTAAAPEIVRDDKAISVGALLGVPVIVVGEVRVIVGVVIVVRVIVGEVIVIVVTNDTHVGGSIDPLQQVAPHIWDSTR